MTAVQQPAWHGCALLGRQRIAARDLDRIRVTDDVTGVSAWRKRKNRFHRMAARHPSPAVIPCAGSFGSRAR